jgi:tripartite-type tricarboxylate transporter receptor subunit TctC
MKLSHRKLLHLTTCAAALLALARAASALDYLSQPLRIILGYAAGGVTNRPGT